LAVEEKVATIEDVLEFMKNKIAATKKPWVPWGELEKSAEDIVGTVRRPVERLWYLMEPHVFSLIEKEPKSKNPKIYEAKLGQAYIYYPVKMIELYAKPKESS